MMPDTYLSGCRVKRGVENVYAVGGDLAAAYVSDFFGFTLLYLYVGGFAG